MDTSGSTETRPFSARQDLGDKGAKVESRCHQGGVRGDSLQLGEEQGEDAGVVRHVHLLSFDHIN